MSKKKRGEPEPLPREKQLYNKYVSETNAKKREEYRKEWIEEYRRVKEEENVSADSDA